MKATLITAVVLFAGLCIGQVAQAQPWPANPVVSPPLWQHHASTFEEGFLRGWADVGRAIGELNYNTSLAMINREEAIRRRIKNRKQFVQTYFDVKNINYQERFGKNQEDRPTQEDLARYSEEKLPERLPSHEYHRVLGKVNWPHVLRDEAFAEERAGIDRAVAARTIDNSGVGSETCKVIQYYAQQMEAKLRDRVSQLSGSESIAARKFLKGLHYEAQMPLGMDASALAIR
jgi:hypothetical protein